MKIKTQNLLLDLGALLVGASLALAFAPIGFYFLALLSPAIFISIISRHTNNSIKRAFYRGWLYGLGFFGVGVSWVYVSIHVYGYAPVWLSAFFTALFVMTLALFPALQAFFLQKYFKQNTFSKFVFIFPASWVILEWIRSWLLTGFPWLLLGHSQTNSPLRGFLSVIGIYGVAFIITLCSGLLAFLIFYTKQFNQHKKFLALGSVITIACIFLSGSLLAKINWTNVNSKAINISLIQGNIPQEKKWSLDYLNTTLQRYAYLTKQHAKSDLIIWPEAAVPLPLQTAKSFIQSLKQFAQKNHIAILFGIPIANKDESAYYNSAVMVGNGEGRYDKQRMVPFGEYVPFEKLLRGLIAFFNLPMSDLISGDGKTSTLTAKSISIAPFICYEIAYNNSVRRTLPQAELLVTMSNDAWFGDSFAPAQHLQIAQAQALQTQRYVAFVSNTGITAIINPQGKIQSSIPQFEVSALTDKIYPIRGETVWIMLGDMPFIVLSFFLIVFFRFRILLLSKIKSCRLGKNEALPNDLN